MATTGGCGGGWRRTNRRMCWRSRARRTSTSRRPGPRGGSAPSAAGVAADGARGGLAAPVGGRRGDGAHRYDWYRLPLVPPLQEGYARWCLVRRSLSDPDDLQAYVTCAPVGTA